MTEAERALLIFVAKYIRRIWQGPKGSKDEIEELIRDVESEEDDG
jgi:hypothetical protein